MRLPRKDFWNGRRVLLTGHTGFKGGWASLWLKNLGAQLSAFSLVPDQEPSLYTLASVAEGMDEAFIDIRDAGAIAAFVRQARPEIVLHMAAQSLLRASIREPVGTIATNVLGTAHLLEALRDVREVKTVLVVTSDKVYSHENGGSPFDETGRLGGKDPYSSSKAACEFITEAFSETYFRPRGVAVATVRGGNVIGGGDFAPDRILPDVVRAAGSGKAPVLRHPEAVRPWQHVLDCIAAYLIYAETLAENADMPSALNIGPHADEPPVTVHQLVERFQAMLGVSVEWMHEQVLDTKERVNLQLDSGLARRILGWEPRMRNEEAIATTAAWYRQFLAGDDMRNFTQQQIEAFQAGNLK